MAIETPSWVRDAVFYQIFPDRFAMSERVVKPGPMEPWDTPPTVHGFKGGDLLGVVDASRPSAAAGGDRGLLQPDLPVGLEPSLPHVRLPRGRPAARRQRRPARADRRLPSARDEGGPRRRLQPRQPRVLAVQPRFGDGCRVAVPGLVLPRRGGARRRAAAACIPAHRAGRRCLGGGGRPAPRRAVAPRPGLPRVVGPAGPAEAADGRPAHARVPARRGRALAPLRGGRLAARCRRGGPGRLLARVPRAGEGRRPRGLHRGRDLDRTAAVPAGRHVRRLHELPAGRGDHLVRQRRTPGPRHRRPALRIPGEHPDRGRADVRAPSGARVQHV